MAENIAGKTFVVTNLWDRGIMFFLSLFLSPSREALIRSIWNHYGNFPLFFIFTIVRLFWILIQGFYIRIIRRIKPYCLRSYEECAMVENVLWTCKPTPIDENRLHYYMTAYKGFTHPNCIFSENVMLSRVFRDRAVFVDFGRPVQKHYTVRNATFLWDETIFDAQRLITMPIWAFHRLAEKELKNSDKIDENSEKLTLLFGSGRCGSTLKATIVDHADPDCLVLSEPVPFIDLYRLHKRIPPAEFRKLILNTLRLLCKPVPEKIRFFFKPICLTLPIAREIRRILPNSRLIYSYRDPLRTAWAHERAFGVTIAYQLYSLCQHFHALRLFEFFSELHPNYRMDEVGYRRLANCYLWETCFMMWAAHHLSHREQTKEFEFPAISYDDVFKSPVDFCRNMLELCGYDLARRPELLEGGMRGMLEDSQEGKAIGQRQLQGYPSTKMTSEIWARISSFSEELGLPLPENPIYSVKQSDKVFMPPAKPPNVGLKNPHSHGKNGFVKTVPEQFLALHTPVGFTSDGYGSGKKLD